MTFAPGARPAVLAPEHTQGRVLGVGGHRPERVVFLHAESSGQEAMMSILREAFPAIVDAAAGDPDVNLAIQVISADDRSAVSAADLGYSGAGTLISYRTFLGK